ncbi:MAG: hypothetical protein R6W90_11330, partial [Ignavibacteriaceae bacterium]
MWSIVADVDNYARVSAKSLGCQAITCNCLAPSPAYHFFYRSNACPIEDATMMSHNPAAKYRPFAPI